MMMMMMDPDFQNSPGLNELTCEVVAELSKICQLLSNMDSAVGFNMGIYSLWIFVLVNTKYGRNTFYFTVSVISNIYNVNTGKLFKRLKDATIEYNETRY